MAAGNPNLLNALNVGLRVVPETGAAVVNPAVLPKFFFPKRLTSVLVPQASSMLASSNPIENALVEGDLASLSQDAAAKLNVVSADAQRYALRTEATTPSLLRAAIPWYPAWRAAVDGREVPTSVVDHAMMGIPVPAGQHEVVLEYHASRFHLGASITLLTAAALLGANLLFGRSQSSAASSSSPLRKAP
jgi:hypothetical protein